MGGTQVISYAPSAEERGLTRIRAWVPYVLLLISVCLDASTNAGLSAVTRVLVLTTYDSDADVLPAIQAGATGYLLKDAPRQDLLLAVLAATRGESVLSPVVAGRLMGRLRQPPAAELSHREVELLRLVARGMTNRQAAAELFVSEATVKTHLLHVYGKLGARDRASAVAEAYNRGLLAPGDM
jgi:DNA-binding NarL/FixJ family response regulator